MNSIRDDFKARRDETLEALHAAAAVVEQIYRNHSDARAQVADHLRCRATALAQELFSVVVVGEMKRGKSTFLNALLGRQVFVADTLEATATVGFMRHNETAELPAYRDRAVVHFQDEHEPFVIALDKLVDYTSKQSSLGAKTVADTVHHVDVFVDSPFVEDRVLLVDTPGTNSTHETHMAITYRQIDLSDAAIFLLNANAAFTQSDRTFFRDMRDKIRRFFFVLNRIDDLPGDSIAKVLENTREKLVEELALLPSESAPQIYGISALKALLARHGHVPSRYFRPDEAERLREPALRHQLLEESRIEALERDLLHYLFRGGKSTDLLQAPIQFLGTVLGDARRYLQQQHGVLEGSFDFDRLERDEAELTRTVAERKLELERASDELVKRLDQALTTRVTEIRDMLDAEEESLRDYLGNFPTLRMIQDNWEEQEGLSTYPRRRLEALHLRAGKLLSEAVRTVLEAVHRTLRGKLTSQLGDLQSFRVPEIQTCVPKITAPELSEEDVQALEALRAKVVELEAKCMELEGNPSTLAQEELQSHRREREALRHDRLQQLQLLGERPSLVETRRTEDVYDGPRGILGALKWVLVGSDRRERLVTDLDDRAQVHYDAQRKRVEQEFREAQAEMERRIQEAGKTFSAAQLQEAKRIQLQKLAEKRTRELEKEQRDFELRKREEEKRAVTVNRNRLLAWFRQAKEDTMVHLEDVVRRQRETARAFIDQISEQLDEQVQTAQNRLAELQQLRQTQTSEREAILAELRRHDSLLAAEEARLQTLRANLDSFLTHRIPREESRDEVVA